MQQDARPSGTEHDFHISRGSLTCVQLQNRLAGSLFRKELWSLVAKEKVEGTATAAARGAAAGAGFGLRDAGDIHTRQRLRVFRKGAVAADHENGPQFVGIAGTGFLDPRVVAAS